MQVQAQDASNNAANVTSDVGIQLTSTGTIGGTTTGTITNGTNTVTITGVTLQEGYNLTITATQTSGTPSLTPGTSVPFNVLVANPNYRTKTSGNWNASTTWEIQISGSWYDATDYPNSSNKNVTIRNGHTVTVTDNNGKCNNLTIDAGGKLWDNSSVTTFFVDVYGNITNNGTIGSSDGGVTVDLVSLDIDGTTCTLSGSGTFDAGRMAKFTTVNATTNFTVSMPITLRYTHATSAALYNAQSGTTTFNITVNPGYYISCPNAKIDLTGSTLTLKSDATGTAALLDNGTITNNTNVTVERYLTGYTSSTDSKYHIITSPVAAQPIQPGFVNLPNTTDDFYKWDEPTSTWINSKTTGGTWNPSFETNFGVGTGYLVAYPSNVTKTFTGALNTYPVASPLVLTCTNTNGSPYAGWNMLGNPVPSSLDWTLITRGDGIDNALYYYDASIENYRYYVQLATGTSVGGGSQYIPPEQGFFVHANSTGTTKTVTITNAARSAQGLGTYYKSTTGTPENYLVLTVDNGTFSDEAYVVFFNPATAGYDGAFDALKLGSLNPKVPQLYTVGTDNSDLAINSLPSTAASTALPLHFKPGMNGTYTLTAGELASFAPGTVITLEDLKTNQSQNLMLNPVYSFQASTEDATARFLLHFTGPFGISDPKGKLPVHIYSTGNSIYVSAENITGSGTVSVYNLLGQEVLSAPFTGQELNIIPAGDLSGYYIVRVVSGPGTAAGKIFVK